MSAQTDARLAWPLRTALRLPGAKTITRAVSEAFVEANFPIVGAAIAGVTHASIVGERD